LNAKYNRLFKRQHGESDFWPTFTDLLTSILLVIMLYFITITIGNYIEIKDTKEQLQGVESQLQESLSVRISISAELAKELEKSLKEYSDFVELDKNSGTIRFKNSEIQFDSGKAVVKPQFKNLLNKVIPDYINIILSKKYRSYVSDIIIEGHTNSKPIGKKETSFIDNLSLSQARALNVTNFLLSSESAKYREKLFLSSYVQAVGMSYRKKVAIKTGSKVEDFEKSKRVEIKFRLKDEENIEKLRKMLEKSIK
jgi:chemotaxis protein MotB